MKPQSKKRKTARRTTVASVKYKQGDITVEASVSEEKIKGGKRYRLWGSVTPRGAGLPFFNAPVFWSWGFREEDLDPLIYFLAESLGYEVDDEPPRLTSPWSVWVTLESIGITWSYGVSTGRVMLPRRSAHRFLLALGTAADWQFTE